MRRHIGCHVGRIAVQESWSYGVVGAVACVDAVRRSDLGERGNEFSVDPKLCSSYKRPQFAINDYCEAVRCQGERGGSIFATQEMCPILVFKLDSSVDVAAHQPLAPGRG